MGRQPRGRNSPYQKLQSTSPIPTLHNPHPNSQAYWAEETLLSWQMHGTESWKHTHHHHHLSSPHPPRYLQPDSIDYSQASDGPVPFPVHGCSQPVTRSSRNSSWWYWWSPLGWEYQLQFVALVRHRTSWKPTVALAVPRLWFPPIRHAWSPKFDYMIFQCVRVSVRIRKCTLPRPSKTSRWELCQGPGWLTLHGSGLPFDPTRPHHHRDPR